MSEEVLSDIAKWIGCIDLVLCEVFINIFYCLLSLNFLLISEFIGISTKSFNFS